MGMFDFSEQERQIFQYLGDDHKLAFVDPQLVQRRLNRAARKASVDLVATIGTIKRDAEDRAFGESGDPTMAALAAKAIEDAIEDLVPLVNAAFLTNPMDGSGAGLTEAETLMNLDAYFTWLADQKKLPRNCPIPLH